MISKYNSDYVLKFIKIIGPGIIAASAAIGTSHLIQSTRAGGYFGTELLWLVILTNILKYPFIEHGFRYAAGAKENMLHGYYKLSPKLLLIFILSNIAISFGAIAAVSFICASIFKAVLGISLEVKIISLIIIISCYLIVAIGHYKYLDKIMKFFMILLLFSTLIAFLTALVKSDPSNSEVFYTDSAWNVQYIPFIIALMGWMPGPIELSVWHSLWLEARNKNQQNPLNFKESAIDFNVGYGLMIITAILFLALGGLILHNSGQELSSNGTRFTSQFILIYTNTIGQWSKPIILIAITAAIFSTTLALIDIYPRSICEGIAILKKDKFNLKKWRKTRLTIMFICCFLAIITIFFFVENFQILIDTVTIISFLSAPLFAYLNYRLVNSKLLDQKYHPPKWIKKLSYLGFAYLISFSIIFIFYRFGLIG